MPLSVWEERRSHWRPQPEDARTSPDVDYARIIHSASFRRLQGKTQILNLGDSDFYRTRLTHSLEVAQIAAGLVRQLKVNFPAHEACAALPDISLIQAIGLAHDLGHPPFGHGGEVALNYCMRDHGGFEGNGQTLRILARLEKFSSTSGADLSRRALLGILKYPVAYSRAMNPDQAPDLDRSVSSITIIDRKKSVPPKCYLDSERDVVEWLLSPLAEDERAAFEAISRRDGTHHKSLHKSFDCSIMDVADDIAYGIHDLEDAIALDLVTEESFRDGVPEAECSTFLDALKEKYPQEFGNNVYDKLVDKLFGPGGERKHYISRLVYHLVTAISIKEMPEFTSPLLRFRAVLPEGRSALLKALKDFVFQHVISAPNVQHLEFKGQKMVVSVFEAFQSDPRAFLPADAYKRFVASDNDVRVLCDHVAGMTDAFLLRTYERLFSPRMGSIFDRL